MVGPLSYLHFSQCSTTGITKVVLCAILFVVRPLVANLKKLTKWQHQVSSHSLRGPVSYVLRHITINKI